jgi:uncharacterized protein YigA (DUF484 family)
VHVKYVSHASYVTAVRVSQTRKQNVTVSLSTQTIQKVRILAVKRSTSISGLLEEQIEALVGQEEAYESSRRTALLLMEQGFRLGGARLTPRDELHER